MDRKRQTEVIQSLSKMVRKYNGATEAGLAIQRAYTHVAAEAEIDKRLVKIIKEIVSELPADKAKARYLVGTLARQAYSGRFGAYLVDVALCDADMAVLESWDDLVLDDLGGLSALVSECVGFDADHDWTNCIGRIGRTTTGYATTFINLPDGRVISVSVTRERVL